MMQEPQILGSTAKTASQTRPSGMKMRARTVRRALAWGLASAIACAALTACGQKGPLYLPNPAQAASTPSSNASK